MSESADRRGQGSVAAWISAGLLLAAVPVGANLFAFVYEVGYCRVFGIPTSFISVQPTTVFVVAGGLLAVLVPLWFIADTIVMIFGGMSRGPIRRSLVVLSPLVLLFVVYLYLYGRMWKEWIWIPVIVAVVAFFEFVFPLIFQRSGSYREKLEAQMEIERSVRSLMDWVGPRVGRAGLLAVVVLLLGLVVAYAAGRANALRQEDFLVLKGEPEAVVLRHYGDTFILAPFDRATKRVERSFFFVEQGDNSRPVFSLEDVGPLRSDH